ncbi:hypothetical protein E2C01_008367 [Portunus trituberculatus]|uniref:Uncharacterized protein n=1 Tax=Portunus trituberculatus TaxID=210409 RepID=A0A5B7D1K8_PORTR|nr:hypothetical protein [Portunus trituberculatus]
MKVAVVCVSSLPRARRDSTPEEYELPANATAILRRGIRTGFVKLFVASSELEWMSDTLFTASGITKFTAVYKTDLLEH